MGFKEIFSGGNKGFQCEQNPDGSRTCTRFKVDGTERVSTGTSVTLQLDEQSCKATMVGKVDSMLDEEMEDIAKLAKNMEAGCRKGIK